MIRIDNYISSNEIETYSGFLQGIVLGPVLFMININGLLILNVGGKIICFADDNVLLFNNNYSIYKLYDYTNCV